MQATLERWDLPVSDDEQEKAREKAEFSLNSNAASESMNDSSLIASPPSQTTFLSSLSALVPGATAGSPGVCGAPQQAAAMAQLLITSTVKILG